MDLFENDRSYADNLSTFIDILMDNFDYSGVMITDRSKILHWRHPDIRLTVDEMTELPLIAVHAMNSGQLETMETPPEGSVWEAALNDNYSAAVPFAVNGQVRGSLVVWVKRTWFQKTIELEFIRIVHNLILFQLSKRELSKQLELTSQAELKALQFQVNPHFLFNALNTISFVCREDSERAVKLLRVLASYFRYSLKQRNFMTPLADEIQHVKDYLRIEEARFEEKLDIRFYEDTESDIPVPILILQPIIENAIRYGISADGYRHVTVRVSRLEGGVSVRIRDRGPGIPEEVLADIAADNDIDDHIGLTNVNRRLKAIYGNEGGLQITSDGDGTVIEIDFYGERQDEQGDR
ncbi:sensor histidine kinase [Mogibacterium timidum]|nr:histidine kinase [Mogibacterium timidum]